MAGFLRDFNAAVATYTAELEQLHARCGATAERAFQPTFWLQHDDFTLARDVFVAAAGSIGHEITKFSLVYSKTPSQEDAESICRAINKPCEQLLSATKVALFCGAGPSLAEELVLGALRVMKSVQELGSTIAKDELARVPELTGRVWESCKAVANTPKSNCIASKRSMLQCISVLNDTIKELKEFLSEQASEAETSESLNDVEDEDEFTFDSSLSDDERALFESGVKLLDMTVAVLKRGVLTLKNLTIADTQQELIAWTAALDRSYKAIQDAVVDMGAALYPPVDVEELTAALTKAEATGVAGLEWLLAQPEIGEAELLALGKGRRAFDQQYPFLKPLFIMTREKIPGTMAHAAIANDALYATPEFVGYSLWLVPDEVAEKRLHGEIQELAARLGTPPFLPHATLLGGAVGMEVAQVVRLTKRVADGLQVMDAEISVVSSKDLLYFQCVFGLLKLSDELREAHSFAMEVFERVEEPEFMPHVSLVYGELSSPERKALAQELGPRLDGLKMTMEKLQVWNTTGPVKNWSLVAEYPLSRGET